MNNPFEVQVLLALEFPITLRTIYIDLCNFGISRILECDLDSTYKETILNKIFIMLIPGCFFFFCQLICKT